MSDGVQPLQEAVCAAGAWWVWLLRLPEQPAAYPAELIMRLPDAMAHGPLPAKKLDSFASRFTAGLGSGVGDVSSHWDEHDIPPPAARLDAFRTLQIAEPVGPGIHAPVPCAPPG